MGKLIHLGKSTTLDLPPDRILESAVGHMDQVILIGIDKNGEEYFASSTGDGPKMMWMAERFKTALLTE